MDVYSHKTEKLFYLYHKYDNLSIRYFPLKINKK